jgi:hypothetical protein
MIPARLLRLTRPEWVPRLIILVVTAGVFALTGCGETDRADPTPDPILTPLPGTGPSAGTPDPGVTPPGDALSVVDFGAVGDGRSDDTGAILSAVDKAASEGVPVWFPRGTYAVRDISLPKGVVLAGAGASQAWLKGRVSFDSESQASDLRVGRDGAATRFADGAARIELRRLTFVGGGGMRSGEDQGVIRFSAGRSASHIRFLRCTIGANSENGNGVSMVSSGQSAATYHDISWERCLFKGSPRMNLEVIQRPDGEGTVDAGYRRLDLVDCTFEPSGSENVSFDAVGPAGDCTISGCVFYGAGWNTAYPYGQGIEFNGPTDMRFVGNTVYRCRGSMINHSSRLETIDRTVIRDNVFDATSSFIRARPGRDAQAIFFSGVSGAVFSGNTVRSSVGGELLYLDESSGNRFITNTWIDERPQGEALACAIIADASSSNRFDADRFRTAAEAAVFIRGGSRDTVFRSCVFLPHGQGVGDAQRIVAEKGVTLTTDDAVHAP